MSKPNRWVWPALLGTAALVLLSLISACNSGEKTLVAADPEAVPLEPTYEMVVGILDRHCVPCHKSGDGGGDEDEGGESDDDDPDYDSCQGILSGVGGLIEEAIQKEGMPPGAWPRLSEEQKLLILRWIQNGACAPCNPCP